MILLEEDKLNELYDEYEKSLETADTNWEIYVAKTQLKEVWEWGNEFCDNHWEAQKRHKCSECWQALLKECEE